MKKTMYIAPRTEQEIVLNACRLLGGSGNLGVSQTPADPSYPGGAD